MPSHHPRRGSRSGSRHRSSVDSYRSRSSRGKGSADSTSSLSSRGRQGSRDESHFQGRSPESRQNTLDDIQERNKDAPPSYDLSQARDAHEHPHQSKEEEGSQTKPKVMSLEARYAWALALSIPLLAAVILLFLITCSSSLLRAKFSVVKIEISQATYGALASIANDQRADSDSSILANAASFGSDMKKRGVDAYMTLGFWGWCAKTIDSTE